MNGPHFGDRYGIVSDLFTALDSAQIELLGLSCSIHSVTGALPGDKIHAALEAIQACFDVPSIIKR
jgi:aspartokinase